ncbi:MAG: LLM class flavin-dependent oxidoreductase [Dehalococcoidia bacterium]|nr:LLM class flavin-dependent oxidoreductase [Dehalococcoidia bacterium]MDE0822875.1 LLM class flavin-dependent oxidoreductase [Dehalococcoidia bacterium]
MTKVKLGILLPTRGLLLRGEQPPNIDRIISLANTVEQAGLDSVWVGDSLMAKPRMEPLAILGALAARTRRVRLGTAVLLPALRHPVLLAQTMATVDLISGGRLVIGAGVGGAFNDDQKREWKAAGVPTKGRGRRFEEIVKIIQGLGSGKSFDFHGRDFDLDSALMRPVPTNPNGIPFLLGTHYRAQSPAQIGRAAQLGAGIISISDSPDEFAQIIQQVNLKAAEFDREPTSLEKTFYMTVNMNPDLKAAEADAVEWLTGYYGSDIWGTRWGPFGDAERVAERMQEYVLAGAETLVVRFASFEPEKQLETFLERVAPIFA